MFKRFFGETESAQIQYLQARVIITIIATALCFFGFTSLFALVMLFVWGWGVVKALFGITTVGAIFSGNVIIGSALFVVYLIIAYVSGLIFAFIGTGRYIYLKVKTFRKEG